LIDYWIDSIAAVVDWPVGSELFGFILPKILYCVVVVYWYASIWEEESRKTAKEMDR